MTIKRKYITEEEFRPIMQKKWLPVELLYDTLPCWMKKVPESQRCHVYASGSSVGISSKQFEGYEVGGFDVFRDARNHPEHTRYQVNWNKDHYVVIRDPEKNDMLLMYGPIKDHEHWINKIPERLKNVEILTFDRKGSGDSQ